MPSKKQIIIHVLNVLDTYSDKDHPITQTRIAEIISDVYPCDRKTVCRNIGFLREMGYPIVKTPAGFYMSRKRFSLDEILFVRLAILTAPGLPDDEKDRLATRVEKTLQKERRRASQ